MGVLGWWEFSYARGTPVRTARPDATLVSLENSKTQVLEFSGFSEPFKTHLNAHGHGTGPSLLVNESGPTPNYLVAHTLTASTPEPRYLAKHFEAEGYGKNALTHPPWGQVPCKHSRSDFTQSRPLVVLYGALTIPTAIPNLPRKNCVRVHNLCQGSRFSVWAQWFRGGLVFKAHRLLHHSTYGARTFWSPSRE
jgi:hypothetical protein